MQQAVCCMRVYVLFWIYSAVVAIFSESASHMCCIYVHAVWLINFKSTRKNQSDNQHSQSTTKRTRIHTHSCTLAHHNNNTSKSRCCYCIWCMYIEHFLCYAPSLALVRLLCPAFQFVTPFGRVRCTLFVLCATNAMCVYQSSAAVFLVSIEKKKTTIPKKYTWENSMWSTARNKSNLIILHDLWNVSFLFGAVTMPTFCFLFEQKNFPFQSIYIDIVSSLLFFFTSSVIGHAWMFN